jgi:hypothetical protein
MGTMENPRGQNPEYLSQLADRGPAVEEHGRVVTANHRAAAWYRQAQRAVDCRRATRALELAVTADPGFALAVADLAAITEAPLCPTGGRPMSWERHHIEVVRTAAVGNVTRATDLLREHLASVGCDPLALRIVTDLRRRTGNRGRIEDFGAPLPGCHYTPMSPPP